MKMSKIEPKIWTQNIKKLSKWLRWVWIWRPILIGLFFKQFFKDTQAKLEQNAEVTNFLRDCTEGVDWIKEKKMDLGGHDHHDEWQKASALSQELAANQSRLDKIRNDGKYVIIYIYFCVTAHVPPWSYRVDHIVPRYTA